MKKITFQEALKQNVFQLFEDQLQHLCVLKTHLEELVKFFKTSLLIYNLPSHQMFHMKDQISLKPLTLMH